MGPLGPEGALRFANPPEMLHAMWFAVARDIDDCKDNNVLQDWRRVFLTCSMDFQILETDTDIYFEQERLREKTATTSMVVLHTGFQRVFKIVEFKRSIETSENKLTESRIVEIYREREVMLSEQTEALSDTFIREAIVIHNRALADPDIVNVVRRSAGPP